MRRLQCLLYKNECYVSGKTINPTKIVLHSTGCDNDRISRYVQPHSTQTTGMEEYEPTRKTYTRAEMISILGKNGNANDWNRSGIQACVHAFIGRLADGSIATVQTLPWTMRCWGCASGSKGSYNNCAIQFEICEDNHASADYCKKTFEEAAQLCAHLMRSYPTIDSVNDIVSHYEAGKLGYGSNHVDPTNWWPKHGLTMDKFRSRVKELLGQQSSTTTPQTPPQTTTGTEMYRIRKTWGDPKSQVGAYRNLESAKKECPDGYTVFDKNGKAVYSKAETEEKLAAAKSFNKSKAGAYTVKSSDGLNLRLGPTTDDKIIETMNNGETVRCYGYHTGVWLLVVSASGKTGYCHSGYLVRK